jgi:hypothetical protein
LPADAYIAAGGNHKMIVIPSLDMIVMRVGNYIPDYGRVNQVYRMIREAATDIPPGSDASSSAVTTVSPAASRMPATHVPLSEFKHIPLIWRDSPISSWTSMRLPLAIGKQTMRSQAAERGRYTEVQTMATWVLFAIGAALSWGVYGPALHKGQVALGNPLRALLCVGVAYFLVGVLVPVAALHTQGQLKGFNATGTMGATLAGVLGAVGAVCIIWAFRSGGLPTYVMPLVFGGAPVVNVLVSMALHPPKTTPNPLLYVGFVMVCAGAGLVLRYKPQ